MNILIITTVSGFLPKFGMQDVKILQEKGFTVHYASNFRNPVYGCSREELERRGVICHEIGIQKSPLAAAENIRAWRKLKKIIREEQIRAVHCHNPVGGVLGRLCGRTAGMQGPYVIYTAHGFHFYDGAPKRNWLFYYPVERFLAKRTDELVTINHEDYRRAGNARFWKAGRVSRIPGAGLDTMRFCPDRAAGAALRGRLGIPETDFVFLSAGELNANKNHAVIIRAFRSLLEKEGAGSCRLLICGRGSREAALGSLIHKLGLEGRVLLCGYQEEIENYYRCADAFLFPSIREGFGMAAVEAMACGLPLVAADNRGSREYAFDNAFVCSPEDADGFCNAMYRLATDEKLRLSMGERGRELSRQFALEKTAEVMEQVYGRMQERLSIQATEADNGPGARRMKKRAAARRADGGITMKHHDSSRNRDRSGNGKKIWLFLSAAFFLIAIAAAGVLARDYINQKKAEGMYSRLSSEANAEELQPAGAEGGGAGAESGKNTQGASEEAGKTWSGYTLEEKYQAYLDTYGIEVPEKTLDFADLQENTNPDIYAWLYVPGTNIDYPVVQHPTDDSYYLDYNLDGSKGYPGGTYTESCNNKEFTDRMTVIYGHNMKNGKGFGTLHNFEDGDFFREQRYIYVYLPDDIRVYEIFAAYEGSSNHIIYGHEWTDESYVQYLSDTLEMKGERDHALDAYEFHADDLVLTLSTCLRNSPGQRYLVQGVLLDEVF